jgi:hypothetical protein
MKTNRWWRKDRLATHGSAEGAPPGRLRYRELGGVVCRRESEGFYDSCGGFSDSGRKVLIPGVMVAIVNIST